MKNNIFPYIIALSALLVSGSAAFYSVHGLGKMFAGASIQVMIMAGSLEFAKIVIASMLHRYWDSINKLLKIYFLIAVFLLIGITSAGIYGFLSSAYQETAFKLETGKREIQLIEGEKKILESEIKNIERQISEKNERINSFSKIRLDQQNSQNDLIKSNKSIKNINSQIKGIEGDIKSIDSDIKILNDSLSSKNRQMALKDAEIMKINSNKDIAQEIGPIKYISEITGKSLATVVNWYIIALMLVFDPLAIALVVAANFAFSKKNEENPNSESEIKNEEKNTEKLPAEEVIENPVSESPNLSEKQDHIEDEVENSEIPDPLIGGTNESGKKNDAYLGFKSNMEVNVSRAEDPTKLR